MRTFLFWRDLTDGALDMYGALVLIGQLCGVVS